MDRRAIEAIKERLDIVDIIRRYVELKPVSGRWMGLCPFHQEKSPSMSVNSEEGFFYCFGCQASGDIFDFYANINGLEFKDALEQLAAEAGVELTPGKVDPGAAQRSSEKKTFLEMHEKAAEYYSRLLKLPEGRTARDYLKKRGVESATIESFGLGCSSEDWQGLEKFLVSNGYSAEQGVRAGLLSQNAKGRTYDRFRGRLIFPIKNLSGRVIAFGGRIIIDGEPKYLNSSDTPIYKKGEHLYGLSQARTSIARIKQALLTEGYMDVISLHQFGYANSCGVLGTALTPEQVKRLSGFCSKVNLVFDGDSAGFKAALRSAEMILTQGVSCGVIVLPDGEDVDSLLQTRGAEGFQVFLDEAREGLDFCLATLKAGYSPREIMDWAQGFLKNMSSASLKAFYIPKVATGLGVAEAELRSAFSGVLGKSSTPVVRKREPRAAVSVGGQEKDDKYFLRYAVQHPEHVVELSERGVAQVLTSHWGKKLWSILTAHSGQDIIPLLDDSEKKFWACCRMEEPFVGEDLEEEWRHVCKVIARRRYELGRKQLTDALRRAQAEGDSDRVNAYLKVLNDSVWRDDEQH
ncbi:DNA primase [Maridesulfovibrio ferrireducens]|uniref:DNA primase n=1 Tax=Maridesulfovibrio ferrireducens TaxID=246191 RepID=A0A1G9HMH8_9BACT|nr:DNA primase [Maridesulfovibrio ferrireducens]SDL14178.1 DNA primase [Maridesulfovibrio ferrireducens]